MEVLLWSIGEYICTERDKGLGVGFLKLERAVGIFCSCAGEREIFYMEGTCGSTRCLWVLVFLFNDMTKIFLPDRISIQLIPTHSSGPQTPIMSFGMTKWQIRNAWTSMKSVEIPNVARFVCPARSSLRIHVPEVVHSSNFHSVSVIVAIMHHQWKKIYGDIEVKGPDN